jgi:DNA sulfur modification protein DndD
MILKRLILQNYCLFAGHHEFDLEPRTKRGTVRPIILFGGKNGAGKTTFLSAIQLAFYGRQALGERITEKDYHATLRNRIHRNNQTDRRASFAKVGLTFDLVVQGEKSEYYIERSWTAGDDSGLDEFFKVERNGKKLEDVSREHLQSFVADIVPERLSQLFFFDGEKIKNIAEDITSNAAISEAIQTLLGFDVVKSLQSDLGIYRSRLLKSANPTAYDQEIASVADELQRLQEARAGVLESLSTRTTEIDGFKAEIARLQKQLAQRGGNYADRREANSERAGELDARHATLVAQVRAACDSTLPFALCPQLSSRLLSEIHAEETLRKFRVLDHEMSLLQRCVLDSAEKEFPPAQRGRLGRFLEEEIARYRDTRRPPADAVERHALSEQDAGLTIEAITRQAPAFATGLHVALAELEEVTRELRVVRTDLQKAPEEAALQDAFAELGLRNQDLGRSQEAHASLTEQLRQTDVAIASKGREKAKIESRLGAAKDVAHKTATIQKLNTALASYMSRLTDAKISQLQSEVTECYNRLARKADFIRRIEISADTFSVAVIDKFGRSIPKEDLSSGEKQIFAIAMLWGLARTSGRPLPVVIDTPLGRLDSDHRSNLIKNYFPHAGHQVLLLSTDTEVDVNLFKELSPAVSHCYHLKYDQDEARTTVDNEYFWREAATA